MDLCKSKKVPAAWLHDDFDGLPTYDGLHFASTQAHEDANRLVHGILRARQEDKVLRQAFESKCRRGRSGLRENIQPGIAVRCHPAALVSAAERIKEAVQRAADAEATKESMELELHSTMSRIRTLEANLQ